MKSSQRDVFNYLCLISRPKSLIRHPPKFSESYTNPNTVPNEMWFKKTTKKATPVRLSMEDYNNYLIKIDKDSSIDEAIKEKVKDQE